MRDDVVTHTHGPGGAHTHGELASITWLDPTLAIEQARAIEAAFSQKWPDSSIRFKEGLTALEADLTELDARLEAVTQQIDEPLVTSHPVYQYLKSRYELDVRSVEFEPDMLPDERALAGLREILSEHKAKWMIWEGDPLPESVELLKNHGTAQRRVRSVRERAGGGATTWMSCVGMPRRSSLLRRPLPPRERACGSRVSPDKSGSPGMTEIALPQRVNDPVKHRTRPHRCGRTSRHPDDSSRRCPTGSPCASRSSSAIRVSLSCRACATGAKSIL